MELKELYKYQIEFDRKHGWDWSNVEKKEEKLQCLLRLAIAMSGEVGEFCNKVKKIVRKLDGTRGKFSKEDWEGLKEELVDIFIYVLKGAAELFKMDLAEEYMKKMRKNVERFEEFEK